MSFFRSMTFLVFLFCLFSLPVSLFGDVKIYHAKNTLSFIKMLAASQTREDSFHVINLSKVKERFEYWHQKLPRVTPYYAVKTNPDSMIVKTLANLGTGFDAASENEIKSVLSTGTTSDRIIFAHARKMPGDVSFSKKMNVKKMTFDSLDELKKMEELFPDGEYVLRLKVDDSHSINPLSSKFGASLSEARQLLSYAKEHKLSVIGLSFHVGSGCIDPDLYRKALLDCALLFKEAKEKNGFKFSLLDLGGGWPGNDDALFDKMANVVNLMLKEHFPSEIKVIAEPGRFFAMPSVAVVTKIIGVGEKEDEKEGHQKHFSYYLSDGIFGSFLTTLYYNYNEQLIKTEGIDLKPVQEAKGELFPSKLWGPTCDSADKIFENEVLLPQLKRGDYLYSDKMGAYTTATLTHFNGIKESKPYYFVEK